ncbi:MAG: hypothetical protein IJA10_10640 [Lachnospiraceae bacterium]|nr:hypothetical protein [Lachnospiraceae bacterium]
MCRSFEAISGKKNKGDKVLLEGLTKIYRDAGYTVALVQIPVDILEIDTRYQTEVRTERDLHYLTNNWNENKLLPLIGVPHWEEGKIYLVDGYGRWIGSQIVDKEKYEYLTVLLILNAPTDKEKRLEFEAEMYAYQNKQVAKMTAIQKHGAMIVLHDDATITLEKLKKKYNFKYTAEKGSRDASVLGSYTETLALCKIDNGKCADWVFEICARAGFDRKQNGYATYMFRALRDIYRLYTNNKDEIMEYFSCEFRKIAPIMLKANSVVRYPALDVKTAVSLYLEDLLVENLGLERIRTVDATGTKLVSIKIMEM